MNKQLIILGMHRSGTSSVAQWIQACGLNIGEKLLKEDFSNKKGHFEDIDFLNLHKEILIENGYDPSGLEEDIQLNFSEYYCKKMEFLVLFKNSRREQWGWKDPRTCLMINQYVELLPNALYLVLYRNYQEVVSSLLRRDIMRNERKMLRKKWWRRLKYSLQKQRVFQNYIAQNANRYLKICNQYNMRIINFLNTFNNNNNIIIMTYSEIQKNDRYLFDLLVYSGLKIEYIPFDNIYDSQMMHNSLLNYRLNDLLIKDAEYIEKTLTLYNQKSLRRL